MHDFEAITFVQDLFSPRTSGSNLPVEFHGDAICLQAEMVDEFGEGESFGTLFGLAINDDGHISSVADGFLGASAGSTENTPGILWLDISPMRIFLASSNPGKLADFAAAAVAHNVEVLALPAIKQIEAPEETGDTFEENARLKAEFYSRHIPGEILIADDSGLVVDGLGGEPGVRSARYAEDAGIVAADPDEANNQLLLKRAHSIPDRQRQCAFVCSIAVARNGRTLKTFTAPAHGMLLRATAGNNGFGYDPLFYFPDLGKSFAELSREEKLQVSHRGAAFRMFLKWLRTIRKETAAT